MIRIAGVDLPQDKPVRVALWRIYGIGPAISEQIISDAGIDPGTRIKDLTDAEVSKIRDIITKDYQVEGDLRREVQFNIKRLIDIGCIRGLRHRMNLPVNGQRTRTNARTRRGSRKTVAGRGQRRGVAKK
jgi:small subunit ribosomal protein S13